MTALLGLALTSPVTTRGWADACLTRLDACPPGLRAPVLAAAAWNAYLADDYPLTQRLAGQILAEPAPGDPLISWWIRNALTAIYVNTGQPERGVSLSREVRKEAAERGNEGFVGASLVSEAMAWTA